MKNTILTTLLLVVAMSSTIVCADDDVQTENNVDNSENCGCEVDLFTLNDISVLSDETD